MLSKSVLKLLHFITFTIAVFFYVVYVKEHLLMIDIKPTYLSLSYCEALSYEDSVEKSFRRQDLYSGCLNVVVETFQK